MRFVAIDFETANPNFSSICQIGVVVFENGSVSNTWQSLVDPEDYFDGMNVSIHGITEHDVKDAPTFPLLFPALRNLIENQIVVSHMPFDRVALGQVIEKYKLPGFDCTWLDSARITRRAWPDFATKGYGLWNITNFLGIALKHHVAQEDARAAGEIVLRAIKDTGTNLEEWLVRANQPISGWRAPIAQEGNPEGPLFSENVVFTGALSIHRHEAAKMAADAGCNIDEGVNKSTTLLVVGDQDIRVLAGHEKSSKHRKAEALIAKGQRIRIIGESDFGRLVGLKNMNVDVGESRDLPPREHSATIRVTNFGAEISYPCITSSEFPVTIRATNFGAEISCHSNTEDRKPLQPAPDANQENPRKAYVYAHLQRDGKVFYVGMGQGRKAWSKGHEALWLRYVLRHLDGKYQVYILQDNLSTEEAESVKAEWMAQCGDTLVNLENFNRNGNWQMYNHYHKLKSENRALIQEAKAIEKNNLAEAASKYVRAIEAVKEYAFISKESLENGIVGKLLEEEVEENGRRGEIEALDRLTMCLIKLGRSAEAAQYVKNYFALYRGDWELGAATQITKRIEKALGRTQQR